MEVFLGLLGVFVVTALAGVAVKKWTDHDNAKLAEQKQVDDAAKEHAERQRLRREKAKREAAIEQMTGDSRHEKARNLESFEKGKCPKCGQGLSHIRPGSKVELWRCMDCEWQHPTPAVLHEKQSA